jgi:hypothetical protein
MPWNGIGVAIAVIVASLKVLGRASSFVVDWAWFSTIGYVGVFWTVFATKAVLFTAVFAISTLLLWVNGALALRFASQRRPRLPATLDPGFPTTRAPPETPTELFQLASLLVPWRLLILKRCGRRCGVHGRRVLVAWMDTWQHCRENGYPAR